MNTWSKYAKKILLVILISWIVPSVYAADHKITFKNNCPQTIWVGQDGTIRDGWEMQPNTTVVRSLPVAFSGRVWPRTGCKFGPEGKCPTEGVDCCDSGGCLSSDPKYFGLACNSGGSPPVSVFELTFDAGSGYGPIDYLDLSAVDGFSVPMQMASDAGTHNLNPDPGMNPNTWCQVKGWMTNPACPPDLWDNEKKICWGPCAYFVNVKGVKEGDNKANICCDNTNVDDPPTPTKKCENDDFIGGFGCSPYGPGADGEKCYAKDFGKRGYWGDIVDPAWPGIATNSLQYIANINSGIPGVYAWQFDDLTSTFFCRKDDGVVDYTITFCPTSLDVAFTGYGLYSWNGTTWTKINGVIPASMAASASSLYAAFTGYGLYSWNGTTWTKINGVLPASMAASASSLYAAFTGYGLYSWNGTTWTKINAILPTSMTASGTTLYAAFTGYGLYKYDNATWTKINAVLPTSMTASGTTLYAAFTGYDGLYKYNGTTWTRINTTAANMAASGSTLYAAFTGYGLYSWNGATWTKINGALPANMEGGD